MDICGAASLSSFLNFRGLLTKMLLYLCKYNNKWKEEGKKKKDEEREAFLFIGTERNIGKR